MERSGLMVPEHGKSTGVHWIDRDLLRTGLLAGTFLNLGSTAAVEIAAQTGFDWLLVDLEHGSGSIADLRNLLSAASGSTASPVVRIPSVDADMVKWVLDGGAAGIMFPFVSSAADARRAVEFSKYPPLGRRGVAGIIRATDFGRNWKQYFETANDRSLVVVQIETAEAVEAAPEIAEVPGVDVLFVGPLDLSVALGTPGDFTSDVMISALERVLKTCEASGRTAGILSRPELVARHREMGFRFLALGSDAGSVASGLSSALTAIHWQDRPTGNLRGET
jgi:2-keto-3-deoxy-L-rhamnonate aldolase RhmA